MSRKRKIQTSRANSHPKFSKTIASEQRSSGKPSETVAGTGAQKVGSKNEHNSDQPTDSALMKWIVRHAAWLIPRLRIDVQSPFYRSPLSIVPCTVRIAESCWSSAILCLLTFQRWEKDLGILHRSWLTDENPLCGWQERPHRRASGQN